MRKSGIPSQFKMAGHTVKIKIVPKSKWKHKGALATFSPERYEIQIPWGAKGTDAQQRACHEFFHLLFYCAGRMDLYEDEPLVDVCGHLLQQALASVE